MGEANVLKTSQTQGLHFVPAFIQLKHPKPGLSLRNSMMQNHPRA